MDQVLFHFLPWVLSTCLTEYVLVNVVELTLNTKFQILSDFLASCLSFPSLCLLLYRLLGFSFRLSKFETFKPPPTSKLGQKPTSRWPTEWVLYQEDKGDRLGTMSGNEDFLGMFQECHRILNLTFLLCGNRCRGVMVKRIKDRDVAVPDT